MKIYIFKIYFSLYNSTYCLRLVLYYWLKQQIDLRYVPMDSVFAAIVGFPIT